MSYVDDDDSDIEGGGGEVTFTGTSRSKKAKVSDTTFDMVDVSDIPYSRKFSPGENFRLFRPGASWAKIFSANYLPSENFVTLKFLHAQVFTRGCQAVLAVVPHDRQLAGIQTSSFSICCLACYFHVDPRVRSGRHTSSSSTAASQISW